MSSQVNLSQFGGIYLPLPPIYEDLPLARSPETRSTGQSRVSFFAHPQESGQADHRWWLFHSPVRSGTPMAMFV